MGGWVSLSYLCFLFNFKKKKEINDKGGDLCQAQRNVRGVRGLLIVRDEG